MTDSKPAPASRGLLANVWDFITSLRLAVVLLSVSIVLVFLGTLAQVHEGLFVAQERWFKSWLIVKHAGDVWWVPPIFPGGYLIGVVFLVNLMCAHLRRFQYPPGGMPRMVLHYGLVFAALAAMSKYLLWSPLWLMLAITALMFSDLFKSRTGAAASSGRKLGVDFVHFGIVVLLVGQLATDMLALETHMGFREGESKSFSEHHRDCEVAFTTDLDAQNEQVVAINQALLAPKGELRNEKLPFTVRVRDFATNADLIERAEAIKHEGTLRAALGTLEGQYSTAETLPELGKKAAESAGRVAVWKEALKAIGEPAEDDIAAAATRISAQPEKATKLLGELRTRFRKEMLTRFKMQEPDMRFAAAQVEKDEPITEATPPAQASNGAAVRYLASARAEDNSMESRNTPFAVLEIVSPEGNLGTWLVAPMLRAQEFEVGGKKWRVTMRFERYYHPFTVKLVKTTHEIYPGTDIPKDFRSRLQIQHPAKQENREVEIYMNSPLRYEGMTFFQYQMGRDEVNANRGTSTLQVVRNPGWFTPYLGCALVGYGMARHFLLRLLAFGRKRRTA